MKSRLFIHIGTHKTGSTAIQRALKAGEKECLGEGLVRLNCHELLTKREWSPEDKSELQFWLRYNRERHSGASHRFLISSECLSGDPMTGYDNAPMLASRLRELTRDFDVKIIVFLRRQDDFIESLYTQKIHEGNSMTFGDFLDGIDPETMNWHKLLESYALQFGRENIITRVYHKDCYPKPQDIIVDFCKMIGLRPEVLKHRLQTVRNQGFSMEAVEMARMCNPSLDPVRRKQLRQMLQVASAKPVFQSYSYLDLEARRKILSVHEDSNDRVRRDYMPAGDDSGLFPRPDEPESPALTSSETALTVNLVKALLEFKEAENRSGMLRLAMRIERHWHHLRQRWSRRGGQAGTAVPVVMPARRPLRPKVLEKQA